MKFAGSFEELKEKLGVISSEGEWKALNTNQKQFRHRDGGILNWYTSTGSIYFQGKPESSKSLELKVAQLLSQVVNHELNVQSGEPVDKKIIDDKSGLGVKHNNYALLDHSYDQSELVIGLVGAVGTDLQPATSILKERLEKFNYLVHVIKVSSDIINDLSRPPLVNNGEYGRISHYIDAGNSLRRDSSDFSILALGVAAKINAFREKDGRTGDAKPLYRTAFIISSLKHPQEIQRMRKIYSKGFFLVGIYADEKRRRKYLIETKKVSPADATKLMSRDEDESERYGQHTRDTFHLSDFFISYEGNSDKLAKDLWRIVDLMFGKPYITPTFDEFAMFMAFSASLRSADLSRQVGAVIAKGKNIVATGANDVPKFGGGLYWPVFDASESEIVDEELGRDYKRGEDSNVKEKAKIIQSILENFTPEERDKVRLALQDSRIKDITEYGRVVHAEMEALLACARNQIGTVGADLYCTTFPCHNCAKHVIAAGVKRVIYVEPYPKSKAFEFHSDSIATGVPDQSDDDYLRFEPFVGVGPRSFFNLFSMSLGEGYSLQRKTDNGDVVDWTETDGKLRMQLLPCSYIQREELGGLLLKQHLEGVKP